MLTKKEIFKHYIKFSIEEHIDALKQFVIISNNLEDGLISLYDANDEAIDYIKHYVKTTIFDTFNYIEKDILADIFYNIFLLSLNFDDIRYDSDNQESWLKPLCDRIRECR